MIENSSGDNSPHYLSSVGTLFFQFLSKSRKQLNPFFDTQNPLNLEPRNPARRILLARNGFSILFWKSYLSYKLKLLFFFHEQVCFFVNNGSCKITYRGQSFCVAESMSPCGTRWPIYSPPFEIDRLKFMDISLNM